MDKKSVQERLRQRSHLNSIKIHVTYLFIVFGDSVEPFKQFVSVLRKDIVVNDSHILLMLRRQIQ